MTRKVKQTKAALGMPTEFVAHNGAVLRQNTTINVTGCPKKASKKHKPNRKGRSRGKKR